MTVYVHASCGYMGETDAFLEKCPGCSYKASKLADESEIRASLESAPSISDLRSSDVDREDARNSEFVVVDDDDVSRLHACPRCGSLRFPRPRCSVCHNLDWIGRITFLLIVSVPLGVGVWLANGSEGRGFVFAIAATLGVLGGFMVARHLAFVWKCMLPWSSCDACQAAIPVDSSACQWCGAINRRLSSFSFVIAAVEILAGVGLLLLHPSPIAKFIAGGVMVASFFELSQAVPGLFAIIVGFAVSAALLALGAALYSLEAPGLLWTLGAAIGAFVWTVRKMFASQ